MSLLDLFSDKRDIVIASTMTFLIGFLLCLIMVGMINYISAAPTTESSLTTEYENNQKMSFVADIFESDSKDIPSPFDWIAENQIHVYRDRVYIDLKGAEWATFTDTNSMDPVIDSGSNAIEIRPKSSEDIHVGDIVSYKSEFADGTLIHRVVETGVDSDGWYMRVKGDNNDEIDPGRIRYDQIQRIVVAIIY